MAAGPSSVLPGSPHLEREASVRIVRALSVRYWLVLLGLGVLVALSQLTLASLITANQDSAAKINISGRQRMLSQRIAMLAQELAANPGQRRRLRASLGEAVETMALSHRTLLYGDAALGIGSEMSEDLRARYFGPTSQVDREVSNYLALAHRAVDTPDEAQDELERVGTSLSDARDALLADLDAIVSQYQAESERHEAALRTRALTYTLLALALLVFCAVAVFRPLVRRVRNEMLQIERARVDLRAILDGTLEGILVTDSQARIVAVNPMFTQVTGYTAEQSIGQTPALLKSGRHGDAFYASLWEELTRTGSWKGEVWNRRKSGEIYPQWLAISTLTAPDGAVDKYVGVFRDITENKRSDEINWHRANFDGLTDLPTRGLLCDRLDLALAAARRLESGVGVLFVDLDRFKQVNDTLGHGVGDKLLTEVAARLRECVRESDTVGRLGGDEFAAALSGVAGPGDVESVVQNMVASLAEPFEIQGAKISISASVGIALFPGDGDDSQTLLERADQAMYHAKKHDRRGYSFFAAQEE